MREISGFAKTVRDLLKDQRYSIDYYQREYRWQKKQVQELVDDLADQFLDSYSPEHTREQVQHYEHYFLGSIVLSRRDGELYIVDGQQRLTTLTLLLVMLHRRQGDRPDRVKLEDLIYSERYGTRRFNIAVPEREVAMDALFAGQIPDVAGASESVETIVARFLDLDELLPSDIHERALPFFCDWLIDNVHLVEITAATDEDAYTIFETMNDRGLSLTPLDMLRGYLLANVKDPPKRNQAARVWRERVESLRRLGKEEDADAVKAWLRARYATSVRERHRGAENRDFERIGTEFHRWIGSNTDALGLRSSDDYFTFMHQEMPFYTRQYERLRQASMKPVPGIEPVYHVAAFNFTLQYPLILSTLRPDDSTDTIDRKIRMVATFLDIFLARRAVNYLSMTFGALAYTMFRTMVEIRGRSVNDLAAILLEQLDSQGCDFDGTRDGTRAGFSAFALNHWSKRYIKVLLARMTSYLEQESGEVGALPKYLAEGKGRFEIEHIWADHPERHRDEFSSVADFADYRNRIGDLLLLPKSFNASFGDLEYHKKLPHYLSQNLLARSLHSQCYERNPGFVRFVQDTGLPFRPEPEFRKAQIDSRTALYRALADRVWDPQTLQREAR